MHMSKWEEYAHSGEPQLGKIKFSELIEQPEEAVNLFLEVWLDEGQVVKTIKVPDDMTNEPIELDAANYFSQDELSIVESCIPGILSITGMRAILGYTV